MAAAFFTVTNGFTAQAAYAEGRPQGNQASISVTATFSDGEEDHGWQ
ncbi:hypothetical protein [Streptomyces minutiscleroticus]|nr:hypothetical protein [Streptomyces minutiscleroticus]